MLRLVKAPPREVTVQIDYHENYAPPFPEVVLWCPDHVCDPHPIVVRTEPKVHMPEGDYGLKGLWSSCLIEKKAQSSELLTNFASGDATRARAAFERLSKATANPIIVVEGSATDLLATPPFMAKQQTLDPSKTRPTAASAVDALLRTARELNIQLHFLGNATNRARIGEMIVRLLLAHSPWMDDRIK